MGIGLEAVVSRVLSALPTVTETAKPAVLPRIAWRARRGPGLVRCQRGDGNEGDHPGAACAHDREPSPGPGHQRMGDPSGTAWTEAGEHRPSRPRRRDPASSTTSMRRSTVLRHASENCSMHGWERVDVVTDHGWILLPGEMEKVELPIADC